MLKFIIAMYYVAKFGGTRLLVTHITDKITGTNKKNEVVYNIIEKIEPAEYEKKLKEYYEYMTLKRINLKKPVTFNEKIQWLKLHDPMNSLKTELTDKYKVRKWVKNKIGEEYLIPLLGVWNRISDIELDNMPEKFVLKTNHSCGTNVFVQDKNKMDWVAIDKQYDIWLSQNHAYTAFELHYKDIEPKVIAEEYIETKNGTLYDYKIHCFGGVPKYILVVGDRDSITHKGQSAYFDMEWKEQSFGGNTHPKYEKVIPRPSKLQEMINIAEILSQDFAYVRVDLYELDDGTIKFGEMTFTPASGMYSWSPPEMDCIWGELLELPQ